jgi:putative FmdB family regulatory protein
MDPSRSEEAEDSMPIYEYECKSCGHSFERITKVGEEAPACPACGADRPQRRIAAFRTNAWSTFLDGMEKRVNPEKYR